MSFATVTRRGFLKGACMLSGGILLGIRMTGKAAAAVKAFKEYMGDHRRGWHPRGALQELGRPL